ncbi:MAG: hypothetical protein MZV64_28000 [Ignavibacteriales bacterium]|nr:hypothetical protein [Ignavibacteriales bacterium]
MQTGQHPAGHGAVVSVRGAGDRGGAVASRRRPPDGHQASDAGRRAAAVLDPHRRHRGGRTWSRSSKA